ncbi:MAG TPA: sulfatase-like hydrolase/transferase [Chitinophagaceae bacterium]|jgi:arylsulfatase A-like enzyme|nr:sulfatase-like hydrolase/transferase [Chitinophagaceae bacterium]
MLIKGNFFLLFVFFIIIASAQTKPNIIYIMADDLGYADLSCYGRKDYQTPNLDKLCSQGVKFMNAYATAPVCTPTRVAFFTGRYPQRLTVGLYEPIAESHQDSLVGLSPQIPSIARLLKKSGYETYLVGKWHLGYQPEFYPNRHGFDYFFGFHAGAIDYISHGDDLYENDKPIQKDGYTTDLWADKAIEIISKQHSNPFFLAVMFNAPHWPWQGPIDKPYPGKRFEQWTSGGSPAIYASMMKSLDDAVGKIVKAVDDLNLSKNTVIIFTSDNGGERYSDNGIYKGAKMSLWEGGIREPAFVRWTGKIEENSVTNQVAATMDWTATILSLAGAKADKKFPLDGMDVMPILLGKKKEESRTLYWRIFQRKQHKAMRDGKWKYLQDEKGNEYLFDLTGDPKEENNLKDKYPAIFNKLKNKYSAWEKTMLKPMPLNQ